MLADIVEKAERTAGGGGGEKKKNGAGDFVKQGAGQKSLGGGRQ